MHDAHYLISDMDVADHQLDVANDGVNDCLEAARPGLSLAILVQLAGTLPMHAHLSCMHPGEIMIMGPPEHYLKQDRLLADVMQE